MGKILCLVIIILISIVFSNAVFAATIPYEITLGIPATPVIRGSIFFTTKIKVTYNTGKLILSSTPDGTGSSIVDDAIDIIVTRPNGTKASFSHRFADNFCSSLNPLSPSDIFDLFQSGENLVEVRLRDICGSVGSSTPLYLVNINAPDPSPTPAPKTPLILIPGIGGSELKVNEDTIWSKDDGHGGIFYHTYIKDEKVWVNEREAAAIGDDDYFDVLKMKADGINSEANLGLTGNLYSGAYQQTINFFTSNGYTLDKDLFIFPYDWRKDISLTSSLLDTKINQIKSQSGGAKVDIVAHSMGGLVARSYIADASRAQNVRKLFSLGTPHLGAPEFLKDLKYGGCLYFELGPFCLSIAPSEVKDVLQNLVGGFELAPTQKYFNFYSGYGNIRPFPFRDDSDIDNDGVTGPLNYDQTKQLLFNLGYNTNLFTPSETFHSLDSTYTVTNGVETHNIVGSGVPTLGQIIERNIINFSGVKVSKKDVIAINGDKTVPLFSASLIDPAQNLSLLGQAKVYYTKQDHGNLVSLGSALDLIKNILVGNNQLPNGISNDPYKLSGYALSVHSPVNIHVFDQNGNHTGPKADGFEVNIPGSSYDSLDDAKFVFLPEDGIYSVIFDPTDNGSFDFKIRKYKDDTIEKTYIYRNIPLTTSTKAASSFDTTSTNPPVLLIDHNGDGITDSQVNTSGVLIGDSNYDYTPPKVSIDTNTKIIWPPNNKMVDVKISGKSLDPNPYSTKFLVEDEYDLVEPEISDFNQTIKLEASRKAEDMDGRKYVIRVIAEDLAGNFSEASVEVIVPHDQRDGR